MGRSAGGIARHVAQITAALDGDDIAIDIAAPDDLPIAFPKPPVRLDIPDGPFGHQAAIARIRELAGPYDVVHAHGLRAGIDSGRAAGGDKFVIATVHNLVHPAVAGRWKAAMYRPAHRMVVRRADRVLAVSREIAHELSGSVDEGEAVKRIEVLHLGIGPEPEVTVSRDDIRRTVRAEGPLVVTVARLSAQKALDVLIDAIASITPDVTAVILGEGPLEADLRRRAREAGVGERVHFLGFRDDVASFVAAADVFVLSSIWEGVPLAAQEAILLGTPVVGTAVGGMPELITDGATGRLVPPRDPAALGAAIASVIDNPERAQRMASEARAALARDFSTERMLDRLRELYLEGAGAS